MTITYHDQDLSKGKVLASASRRGLSWLERPACGLHTLEIFIRVHFCAEANRHAVKLCIVGLQSLLCLLETCKGEDTKFVRQESHLSLSAYRMHVTIPRFFVIYMEF